MEQLSLSDVFPEAIPIQFAHCNTCDKARYSQAFKMLYCAEHRTIITDHTIPQAIIGCKGKDYIKRGIEK